MQGGDFYFKARGLLKIAQWFSSKIRMEGLMKRSLLFGLILSLALCSAAGAADDWQMWNKYQFKLPVIKNKLFLKGTFETRFRDDVDEFYRYHFYIGPYYKLYKWLTVGCEYGNIQSGDPGDFHTENRLMYYVTPKFSMSDLGVDKWLLGPLTLTLQNRVDWRIRYYTSHVNTWRYRIYPKFSYPVLKTEKLTISPYVGDAFYFDFTNGIGYNQNRIYGGLGFTLFKDVGLNLYYMRLTTRSGNGGDWTGSHIIGTGAAYDF